MHASPAYIVNLSGGKDSTAMLHWMIEHDEPIYSVLFVDTGWEFPEMIEHIQLVEKNTGVEIVRLKAERPFDYWMFDHVVHYRSGPSKGHVRFVGCGWPWIKRRWCTREKLNVINKYVHSVPGGISCVGIAADELHRVRNNGLRYPLVEYGKTGSACLAYCKTLGYHWGGLYELFDRVSCWCCPFQSVRDARRLRKYKPALWQQLLEMGKRQPKHGDRWMNNKPVSEWERRFAEEDLQMELPFDV